MTAAAETGHCHSHIRRGPARLAYIYAGAAGEKVYNNFTHRKYIHESLL